MSNQKKKLVINYNVGLVIAVDRIMNRTTSLPTLHEIRSLLKVVVKSRRFYQRKNHKINMCCDLS